MVEDYEISLTKIEVARIESDTGIYTPSFISDLPAIDKEQVTDFAIQNNLVLYKSYNL